MRALRAKAHRGKWPVDVAKGLHYAYVDYRTDSYPSREEYYVVAQRESKAKPGTEIDAFNAQWQPQQFGISFPAGA